MTWLNEHDVRDAVRYIDNPHPGDIERPNLKHAVYTLEALVEWTNQHSDGWHSWPKPGRAAAKLQDLIQEHVLSFAGRTGQGREISDLELRRALSPIKAFLTRQKIEHEEVIR